MSELSYLTDSFDKKHLWHPYTSALDPLPALKVVSARDRTLELVDGTKLIDAMSSWWCCNLGYQIPEITAALKQQVDRLSHVMFAGLTHDQAIELGKRLLKLLPGNEHIFYADSGSVATEVAMKMALQYQHAKAVAYQDKDDAPFNYASRNNFITVRSGYHGDTWNAMSVCDPAGMHNVFGSAMQQRLFAPNPQAPFSGSIVYSQSRPQHVSLTKSEELELVQKDLENLRKMFAEHSNEIAALILEPIVQGAGGMFFYSPEYLKGMRALCDEFDIVLILDEIATGFGRTGKLFAQEYAQVTADITMLGKGLTAGYMTLSAVLCASKISDAVSKSDPYVFMHGPTFMANPLACSVACASIDALLSRDWSNSVKSIEEQLKNGLKELSSASCVDEIRVFGAIGVVQMHERVNVKAVQQECLKLGVWLRPMGNLLYCMPPFTTTKEEMDKIIAAMCTITRKIDDGSIPAVPQSVSLEDNPV